MRFDKRGISAIVATVLIILITVAAVAIVWVAIIPMVTDKLDTQDFDVQLNVETSGGYTVYDEDEEKLLVRVGRGVDESVIDKLRVIVSFNGSTYSEIVDAPETNQYKVYSFNVTNYVSLYGIPTHVKVAPLILKAGSVKEGMASSNVEISEGKIVNVDSYDWEIFGEGVDDGDLGGCIEGDVRDTSCGDGVCASTGEETCVDGGWANDNCEEGDAADVKICNNNIDEDCDGVDESEDCVPFVGLISWWTMDDIDDLSVIDYMGVNNGTMVPVVIPGVCSGEELTCACITTSAACGDVSFCKWDVSCVANAGIAPTCVQMSSEYNCWLSTGGVCTWADGSSNYPEYNASGLHEGAMEFESEEWIDLGQDAIIGNRDSYSISVWFKTKIGVGTQTIYGELNSASSTDAIWMVDFGTKFYSLFYAGGSTSYISGGEAVNDNEWHHVVSIKRAADDYEVYLDGDSIGTKDATLGKPIIDNVGIGHGNFSGTESYFVGSIDELMLYDRALSVSEINGIRSSLSG